MAQPAGATRQITSIKDLFSIDDKEFGKAPDPREWRKQLDDIDDDEDELVTSENSGIFFMKPGANPDATSPKKRQAPAPPKSGGIMMGVLNGTESFSFADIEAPQETMDFATRSNTEASPFLNDTVPTSTIPPPPPPPNIPPPPPPPNIAPPPPPPNIAPPPPPLEAFKQIIKDEAHKQSSSPTKPYSSNTRQGPGFCLSPNTDLSRKSTNQQERGFSFADIENPRETMDFSNGDALDVSAFITSLTDSDKVKGDSRDVEDFIGSLNEENHVNGNDVIIPPQSSPKRASVKAVNFDTPPPTANDHVIESDDSFAEDECIMTFEEEDGNENKLRNILTEYEYGEDYSKYLEEDAEDKNSGTHDAALRKLHSRKNKDGKNHKRRSAPATAFTPTGTIKSSSSNGSTGKSLKEKLSSVFIPGKGKSTIHNYTYADSKLNESSRDTKSDMGTRPKTWWAAEMMSAQVNETNSDVLFQAQRSRSVPRLDFTNDTLAGQNSTEDNFESKRKSAMYDSRESPSNSRASSKWKKFGKSSKMKPAKPGDDFDNTVFNPLSGAMADVSL